LERDAVNASATHLFGVVSVMVKEEEIALGQRSVFKSYSANCMKEFRTRPTNSQQVRVVPDQSLNQKSSEIQEAAQPKSQLEPKRWDKIKKRSSIQRMEAVEQDANDERSFIPDIKVYSGAKPFQSRVANLN